MFDPSFSSVREAFVTVAVAVVDKTSTLSSNRDNDDCDCDFDCDSSSESDGDGAFPEGGSDNLETVEQIPPVNSEMEDMLRKLDALFKPSTLESLSLSFSFS